MCACLLAASILNGLAATPSIVHLTQPATPPSPCAGVWRRKCIETSGGWNSRTTVEDMDLSLRAYIRGWKAIFLQDVNCLNEVRAGRASLPAGGDGIGWGWLGLGQELRKGRCQSSLRQGPSPPPPLLPAPQLPASFFAYRKQQHRWTCGPIQLWSKASADIWKSQLPLLRWAGPAGAPGAGAGAGCSRSAILPLQLPSPTSLAHRRSCVFSRPTRRKLELILFYFGVRKCSTHFVSFCFFCTLVPLSVFTPEVRRWAGSCSAQGSTRQKA